MKQIFFNVVSIILFLFSIYSCSNQEKLTEVIANKSIQQAIDSLITQIKMENVTYELFVNKLSNSECDIILHAGTSPYYNDSTLCLSYMKSNCTKIKIYSGLEIDFNLPDKQASYYKFDPISKNKDHSIWILHLHEGTIEDVYEANYLHPFIYVPSSPKYYVAPVVKETIKGE